MKTEPRPKARDATRGIGAALLESVRQLKSGHIGRSTTFEALPDGSVRRTGPNWPEA